MKFAIDKCPKCGEPPRSLRSWIYCSVPLLPNNLGFYTQSERLRKIGKYEEIHSPVELECGGGHRWQTGITEVQT